MESSADKNCKNGGNFLACTSRLPCTSRRWDHCPTPTRVRKKFYLHVCYYTHCNAHCLNLAIVHYCDIPMIRNMIGTVNEMCCFYKSSPKRHELLATVIKDICPHTREITLISLCRTRWVERHEAFEVFYSLFRAIVETLEVMANERVYLDKYGSWTWDQETRTKANSFLAVIAQFKFAVTMITVMQCFSVP